MNINLHLKQYLNVNKGTLEGGEPEGELGLPEADGAQDDDELQ